MLDITPLHLRVDRTVLEPWRKLLLDAADYIDQHGWIQGYLTNGKSVCARGAILVVRSSDGKIPYPMKIDSITGDADRKLSEFIYRASGVYDVPTWNDQCTTSQAKVTGTMRECALEGMDQF